MRALFIAMRGLGYGAVLYGLAISHHLHQPWQWVVALFITVWGVWDQQKRPDDTNRVLRRGVIAEFLLIVIWCLLMRDAQPLFLLLSPLLRSCVHLRVRDTISLFAVSIGVLGGIARWFPFQPGWVEWILLGALVAFCAYGLVIGEMVKQRDQIRRITLVSAMEREQQVKVAERVRMASQLHDVMGQYWTAVIRALDVAISVQDERQQQFVSRARDAAMQGLREMRKTVQEWHGGTESPARWMQEVTDAVRRLSDWGGVKIQVSCEEIEWRQFAHEELAAEAVARTMIEALTNAVRHGHASHVTLQMKMEDGRLKVTILDDGTGFQVMNEMTETGIGLRTMKKLAEDVNGTLQIFSQKGTGTTVTLQIPTKKGAE